VRWPPVGQVGRVGDVVEDDQPGAVGGVQPLQQSRRGDGRVDTIGAGHAGFRRGPCVHGDDLVRGGGVHPHHQVRGALLDSLPGEPRCQLGLADTSPASQHPRAPAVASDVVLGQDHVVTVTAGGEDLLPQTSPGLKRRRRGGRQAHQDRPHWRRRRPTISHCQLPGTGVEEPGVAARNAAGSRSDRGSALLLGGRLHPVQAPASSTARSRTA
jgi:hypothetical protein